MSFMPVSSSTSLTGHTHIHTHTHTHTGCTAGWRLSPVLCVCVCVCVLVAVYLLQGWMHSSSEWLMTGWLFREKQTRCCPLFSSPRHTHTPTPTKQTTPHQHNNT